MTSTRIISIGCLKNFKANIDCFDRTFHDISHPICTYIELGSLSPTARMKGWRLSFRPITAFSLSCSIKSISFSFYNSYLIIEELKLILCLLKQKTNFKYAFSKDLCRNNGKKKKWCEIVYYEATRIMRVITRRATMLAGDRSQGVVEA